MLVIGPPCNPILSMQIVEYTADEKGYRAKVRYVDNPNAERQAAAEERRKREHERRRQRAKRKVVSGKRVKRE